MPGPKRNDRTDAQSRILAEAVAVLVEAQDKAVAMIRESGLELSSAERNSLGFRCSGKLPPPPTRTGAAVGATGARAVTTPAGRSSPTTAVWAETSG